MNCITRKSVKEKKADKKVEKTQVTVKVLASQLNENLPGDI